MATDKQLKIALKKRIRTEYAKFFPVDKLKELGFSRKICAKCDKAFWSSAERDVCGDSLCEGSYSFIGKKRDSADFIEVWQRFEKLFVKKGYHSIKRYPSVARWNPSMYFTLASIANFQPYVVSGEVEPPFDKLVVPQTCIRFNDTDNVGITGGHYTGFTMIGQHAFLPSEKFNQSELFEDYYSWYVSKAGMNLQKHEFVIHEDAWAGGGNFGPCLEFFSGGVEIGNQVYMLFESTPEGKTKELKKKVLDMGMGQERCAWFLSGSPTSYDVNFPTVTKYLFSETGIKKDSALFHKFVALAGTLNNDETDDVEAEWTRVAKATGLKTSEQLKKAVLPVSAAYSIADHTRTLLYAIGDGALPGNVGGGYNLRVIFRRMMNFMDKYNWKIDLDKVVELHARYLKPQYPELQGNVELVKKILAIEKQKHTETKKRNAQIISRISMQNQNVEEKLVELYDSSGILPEEIADEAAKHGLKITIPDNFYAKVAERHESKEIPDKHSTSKIELKKVELDGIPETDILYYDKWDLVDFDAFVLETRDKLVWLNQTAFYPTSGGQMHDIGSIGGKKVVQVFKQDNRIIHELAECAPWKKGSPVKCHIDLERRYQLAQHHTAAHILNGAARAVLGEQVWQAGAAKTPEKARLDITHYDALSEQETAKIENLANEIIRENRPVHLSFMERNIAEREYGFRLYQGGAVPGKRLRIVNIEGFDVEACAGTHLYVTGDVRAIKITKVSKIQDGIVRLEFVAGAAASRYNSTEDKKAEELANLLDCTPEQVPARAKELFEKWKLAMKAKSKGLPLQDEWFRLSSTESYDSDPVEQAARILKTQKEHIANTVIKFRKQIQQTKEK